MSNIRKIVDPDALLMFRDRERRHEQRAAAIDASWQERMRIALEDAAVLRGKLAAAERERDELKDTLLLSMRAIAVDGLGLLDPLSDDAPDQPPTEWHGLLSQKVSAIRAQREALLAALRSTNEAIAAELERMAMDLDKGGQCYTAKILYREFPDRLHESVGVVEGAALLKRACELRAIAAAEGGVPLGTCTTVHTTKRGRRSSGPCDLRLTPTELTAVKASLREQADRFEAAEGGQR